MPSYIITGSTALAKYNPNRKVNDLDFFYPKGVYKRPIRDRSDGHALPQEIFDLIPYHTDPDAALEYYATLDALYTIKLSHMAWNIQWYKHFNDVLWMVDCGATLIEPLYDALKKFWAVEHGNKDFLSLNKNKDDFFDDFVTYTYDHDYLHELVAHPNPPMYTKALKDGEQVLIDKQKFDLLPYEEQLQMFREEITVIACERFLIPGKFNWKEAYLRALQLTITNLTKNWANDFILRNLVEYRFPEYKMFKHLIQTLKIPLPEIHVPGILGTKDSIAVHIITHKKSVRTILRTLGNLNEVLISWGEKYYKTFINHPSPTTKWRWDAIGTVTYEVRPQTKTINVYE